MKKINADYKRRNWKIWAINFLDAQTVGLFPYQVKHHINVTQNLCLIADRNPIKSSCFINLITKYSIRLICILSNYRFAQIMCTFH